jgi:hypothetical protein
VNVVKRVRPLTFLPGKPVVVIPSHPVKNADNDNMVPYGGGSILNEIDGNLAMLIEPTGLIQLTWQRKFRGPNFDPLFYSMDKTRKCPLIVDSSGSEIPLPVMFPADENENENIMTLMASADRRVMKAIAENPGATHRELSAAAGVAYGSVGRAINRLKRDKLVRVVLDKLELTKEGEKAL